MPRYNANFTSTSEGKNYLLCNGSTYDTSKYSKLYAVLRTNVLPNLVNRVLWGSNTGGTYLAAGLPNITGSQSISMAGSGGIFLINGSNGAFYAIVNAKKYCDL